jgi:uncharacterized membrane-anchored protein YitT (DUF2179 family)
MYGAISCFICFKVVDIIQSSWLAAVSFNIITNKPDEVGELIYNEVKRGVTKIGARGGYKGDTRTLCICILHKGQAFKLKSKLKELDPDSFSYITKVERTFGKGFLGVVHAESTFGNKKIKDKKKDKSKEKENINNELNETTEKIDNCEKKTE